MNSYGKVANKMNKNCSAFECWIGWYLVLLSDLNSTIMFMIMLIILLMFVELSSNCNKRLEISIFIHFCEYFRPQGRLKH